jgi:four helix bundle protein
MRQWGFRDLKVYNAAFELAVEIFETSKSFPDGEMYGLTSQIRRSSKSVAANIASAYRKKRFPKAFFSKILDADEENTETQVWLEFCRRHGYVNEKKYEEYIARSEEIGRMLGGMIQHPEKFSERP